MHYVRQRTELAGPSVYAFQCVALSKRHVTSGYTTALGVERASWLLIFSADTCALSTGSVNQNMLRHVWLRAIRCAVFNFIQKDPS